MDTGHIVLTGCTSEAILRGVELVAGARDEGGPRPIAAEYEIRDTSQRVLRLIASTAQFARRREIVPADMPAAA
jgi:UDP-N-acetylglucosamine 2-epimerase (non-hydrolysing)